MNAPNSNCYYFLIYISFLQYRVLAAGGRATSRPTKCYPQYRGVPFGGDNGQNHKTGSLETRPLLSKHSETRTHSEPTMRFRVATALFPWPSFLAARALPSTSSTAETRRWPLTSVPSRRNLSVYSASGAGKMKSIDDLPGPSLATTLYWLFVEGYADKSHLLQVWFWRNLLKNLLFSSFLRRGKIQWCRSPRRKRRIQTSGRCFTVHAYEIDSSSRTLVSDELSFCVNDLEKRIHQE